MLEQFISEVEEVLGCSLKEYREGSVRFYAPVVRRVVSASDVVFYNPRMEFSRDVSVCLVHAYYKTIGKEMDLCEPLASCGVRVVRWACEVPEIRSIVAGDVNPRAVFLANVNATLNCVLDKVKVFRGDANLLLDTCLSRGHRFDVVDIDPFGSPVHFIDAAIRVLKKEGGLLCATATDMQPLCGIHEEACLRKYGGMPLRTEYCHEIAVRLLIGAITLTASRCDAGVRVLFSHSSDHYVRTYLLVSKGVSEADKSLRGVGYILHCFNCDNRKVMKLLSTPVQDLKCELCGSKMKVAGPLWCGELWDRDFVDTARAIAEDSKRAPNRRLVKMLSLITSELDGPPTYYDLHSISDSEGLNSPSTSKIVELLREKGFFASPTHFKGTCVRTTADIRTIRSLIKRSS
nr:tRNA (guanine(10)-N(2))-dimethyltransferase [Candidatus Njordarchaeota archaeon]